MVALCACGASVPVRVKSDIKVINLWLHQQDEVRAAPLISELFTRRSHLLIQTYAHMTVMA